MSRCRRYDERDRMEPAAWREHLRGCAECALEERADRLLRQHLAGEPPRLPSDFHRRVTTAARRRAREIEGTWRRRLMAGYWLAATVAGYLVIVLSWPERLDGADWLVLGGSTLLVAVPTLILRRLLRADLMEVWFRTFD